MVEGERVSGFLHILPLSYKKYYVNQNIEMTKCHLTLTTEFLTLKGSGGWGCPFYWSLPYANGWANEHWSKWVSKLALCKWVSKLTLLQTSSVTPSWLSDGVLLCKLGNPHLLMSNPIGKLAQSKRVSKLLLCQVFCPNNLTLGISSVTNSVTAPSLTLNLLGVKKLK